MEALRCLSSWVWNRGPKSELYSDTGSLRNPRLQLEMGPNIINHGLKLSQLAQAIDVEITEPGKSNESWPLKRVTWHVDLDKTSKSSP